MQPVLVLYYSRNGSTKRLADAIAQGVSSLGAPVIVRTVKSISDAANDAASSAVPEVSLQELEQCSALALGSPTRFGNMAAPVKHFLDSTSSQWLKGALIDKPACVFTSSFFSFFSSLSPPSSSPLLPFFSKGERPVTKVKVSKLPSLDRLGKHCGVVDQDE